MARCMERVRSTPKAHGSVTDEDVQALPENPGERPRDLEPRTTDAQPAAGALGFQFRGLTIERLIGVCADTSRVFTARDSRSDQAYQLTIFDPRMVDVEVRPKLRERLKLVQELDHTCFVPLASTGQWGDLVYALRPLPQVWPLRTVLGEYVRQGGEFPGRLVAAIGVEINDLLGYLHEARSDAGLPMRAACGVLTLDNVGIQTDGQLVYMGVPQPLADDEGLRVQAPDRADVVAWQAPEQISGAASSSRTDVYALGLLLASLVCGGNPLQRGTVPATREAVRAGMASDDHLRAIPAVLAAVLRHTLSPDPAHREPDSRHLTMALNRVRMGYGAETVPADILELIVELFGPGAAPPSPPSVQGDEAFLALLGGWCAAGGSTEPADAGGPVPEDDPTADRAAETAPAAEPARLERASGAALPTPSPAAAPAQSAPPAASAPVAQPESTVAQASGSAAVSAAPAAVSAAPAAVSAAPAPPRAESAQAHAPAAVSTEPRRSSRSALLMLGGTLFVVVLLVGAVVAYQRNAGVAPPVGPTQVTAEPSPAAPTPPAVAMPSEPAPAELPPAEVPVDPSVTPPPVPPVVAATPAGAKPAPAAPALAPSAAVVAPSAAVVAPAPAVVPPATVVTAPPQAAPPPATAPAPAAVVEAAPPEAAPIPKAPPVAAAPAPAPAAPPAAPAPRAYNRDAGSALPERYEARNIQEIKKVLGAAEEYAVRAGVSAEIARGSTATLGEALLAAYSPGEILVLRPHAIFLAIVAGGEAGQSAATLRAGLARAHARGAL